MYPVELLRSVSSSTDTMSPFVRAGRFGVVTATVMTGTSSFETVTVVMSGTLPESPLGSV